MATTIAGILGIEDSERVYINTVGQSVVYDAVNRILTAWDQELRAMMNIFVNPNATADYAKKFKNLQGGRMQKQGTQAPAGAALTVGDYSVGFPLDQFGDAQGNDRIGLAYLNIAEVDRQLKGLMARSIHTTRWEILHRLLDDQQLSYTDEYVEKTVVVEPLANGDAVVYAPLRGQEDGATDDHYLGPAYAPSAISDSNNPISTLVGEVSEHYGEPEDMNLITFINPAERAKIEALAGFVEVSDRFIQEGADTAQLIGLPAGARVPGAIIGRTDSSWIVKWDWMPAAYMLTIGMDGDRPLTQRVDPADTGLASGLRLVSTFENEPFRDAQYQMRFGFGTFDRTKAAVAFVDVGGAYVIPSAYD